MSFKSQETLQSVPSHLSKRGRVDSDVESNGSPHVLQSKFPVILSINSPMSKSFSDFSFAQLNEFVKKLESLVKPVNHTRIASRGDLFIYPVNEIQKNLILQLSPLTINDFVINISKTNAELECKGVKYGAPIYEPDKSVSSLLKVQGALEAVRVYKTTPEGKTPTRTWI